MFLQFPIVTDAPGLRRPCWSQTSNITAYPLRKLIPKATQTASQTKNCGHRIIFLFGRRFGWLWFTSVWKAVWLWLGIDLGNSPSLSVGCLRLFQDTIFAATELDLQYWDGSMWGQIDYQINRPWSLTGFSGSLPLCKGPAEVHVDERLRGRKTTTAPEN